jgi:hypothetical protein
MFLGAVSGGLVALGLIATASRVGTAFYAFGLVLLPTLAFTGLVTFERALQSGIEDLGYARRIALLRGLLLRRGARADPISAERPRTAASRSSPTTPAGRRKTAPAPSPGVVGQTLAGIPNGRGHGRGHHGRTCGLRRRAAHRHRFCSLAGGCARRRRHSGRGHAGCVDAVSGISMEALPQSRTSPIRMAKPQHPRRRAVLSVDPMQPCVGSRPSRRAFRRRVQPDG